MIYQKRHSIVFTILVAIVATNANAVDCDWIGGGGDDSWQTPGNWDCNLIPGTNDTATIATNATVSLDADVTVNEFTMSVGTLEGNADIAVTNQLTWSGGAIRGNGSLELGVGSFATLSGSRTLGRTLINAGTLDWTGAMSLDLNAAINNMASGLFRLQGDLTLGTFGDANVFSNEGTFVKASGLSNAFVETVFNSTGVVEVTSGVLWFRNNASIDGELNSASGEFSFRNGTQTLESGLSINANRLSFVNDTVNVDTGDYSVAETVVNGATVNFNAASYDFPTLVVSRGVMQGNSDSQITGQFTWSGGSLGGNGVLVIPDNVTADWSGAIVLGRTLQNAGTVNLGGTLNFGPAGSITNQATGEFRMGGDLTVGTFGSANVFTNEGSFIKSSGFGNGFVEIVFNSTGSVNVQSGVLWFRNQASFDGDLTAPTAEVSLRNGSQTLQQDLQVNVDTLSFVTDTVNVETASYSVNNTQISGATANFNGGDYDLRTLTVTSGTLQGDGNFTVLNDLNWNGGSILGAGELIIPAGVEANLTGAPTLGRTLNNEGTVSFTGALTLTGQSAIHNQASATFNMAGDLSLGTFGVSNVFDNLGTFNKSAGLSNGFVELVFNNTGTINVQSGVLWFRNNASFGGDIEAPNAGLRFTNGVQDFTDQLNLQAGSIAFAGATATLDGNTITVDQFQHTSGSLTTIAPLITVLGDLTKTGGTLTVPAGLISFSGGNHHDFAVNQLTEFNDIMVGAGDLVNETVPADNIVINGVLVNDGIIRKRKPTTFAGKYSFGLTGVEVDVATLGFLTEIQVDRMDRTHPTPDFRTQHQTLHWTIVPTGEDSIMDISLPHNFGNRQADALACWLETLWRCGRAASTSALVTTTGLEDVLSTAWTVGDLDIILEDRLEGDLLPIGTIEQLD